MSYEDIVKQGKSYVVDLKKIRYNIAKLAENAKKMFNIPYIQFGSDIGLTINQIQHIMKEYQMAKNIKDFNDNNGNEIMKTVSHLRRYGLYSSDVDTLNAMYNLYKKESPCFNYVPKLIQLRKYLQKNSTEQLFIEKIKQECVLILEEIDKKEKSA